MRARVVPFLPMMVFAVVFSALLFSVQKPPGLPVPVDVPQSCSQLTSKQALNARLSVAELSGLEEQVDLLVRQDQQVRKEEGSAWEMAKADQVSTLYVRKVLRTQGWPSANRAGSRLAQNMWLLVQHTDASPDLQACVLDLISRQQSTLREKRNFAYLTDRVRLAQGKLQVYGTQVMQDDVQHQTLPRPLMDPENVDVRRASVGLEPLAGYLKGF